MGVMALALVVGACTADETAPTESAPSSTTSTPASTTTSTTVAATTTTVAEPIGLTAPYVRDGTTDEVVYFVMTDRFENGDPSNDRAGIADTEGPLTHGFLPEHRGFYHGGDFAGLMDRLDYVAGLGVTAIWVTPPFTNRFVQGSGTLESSSAGYHGYWQIDYSAIDPHLGTNQEFRRFVEAAHERGLKVILDVVTNHTGDVITYEEGGFSYRATSLEPYRDADGNEFDVDDYVGTGGFPELDRFVSFPYVATFPFPEFETIKQPEWLNDTRLYHNRGNSTFTGESSLFGDFYGLDDLFTEHPRVVEGMIDLHTFLIGAYDLDGYRVDTVKHVNDEFWEAWVPAVLEAAAAAGKEDFLLFGEVLGESSAFRSAYTTRLGFPAVLDFGIKNAIQAYTAQTQAAKVLADHFDDDDWFTDTDSNAGMLPTFVGNHDQGRIGDFIETSAPGANDGQRLARSRLAHEVVFLSRGIPIVYYGDEQGFTGDGGDQGARQDMFPSLVDSYNDDDLIGTEATTADDNFDTGHPLYRAIAELTELRRDHPTLASGAHVTRHADATPGVYAASRIDRDELVEYLVAFNNTPRERQVTVQTDSATRRFTPIYATSLGEDGNIAAGSCASSVLPCPTAAADGAVDLVVPPFGSLVLVADGPVGPSLEAPSISFTRPADGAEIPLPRFRIEAQLDRPAFVEVTFSLSIDGGPFEVLGTDAAPPYRIFWDTTPYADGSEVEIMATVDDLHGHRSVGTVSFTLIERPEPRG
jgi:glycosidase